jgi:hypothetical protein
MRKLGFHKIMLYADFTQLPGKEESPPQPFLASNLVFLIILEILGNASCIDLRQFREPHSVFLRVITLLYLLPRMLY